MTTTTTPAAVAPLQYGKNVRAPSMTAGTKYVRKVWSKEATYDEVEFVGFKSGGTMHNTPNKRIKDMVDGDLYVIKVGATTVELGMMGCCIIMQPGAVRVTFFETLGNSTAAATGTVKKPTAETKPAETAPATSETAPEAPKKDRNTIRREQRAAAKAKKEAEEAAKSAPLEVAADEPEAVEAAADAQPETEAVVEAEAAVEEANEAIAEADADIAAVEELQAAEHDLEVAEASLEEAVEAAAIADEPGNEAAVEPEQEHQQAA